MEKRTTIFEETTAQHQLYDVKMVVDVVETPIGGHPLHVTRKTFHVKLTGHLFVFGEIALTAILNTDKILKLMEALDQHLSKAEKA